MHDLSTLEGRSVVMLSWRDTRNPEGGGAERYLESMATGLAAIGARVTVFCAAHAYAPKDEVVDGVRFVRRGNRLTIYLRGMLALLLGRLGPLGRYDLVVDVQNGMPFLARLVTRRPVVVLVHHVHREQWHVVMPGPLAAVGWWIESSLAPRIYRGDQYVAVSHATRRELRGLGVEGPRVAVVHNGTSPRLDVPQGKAAAPTLAVVGRLVPHKQVEQAIDTALALRAEFPDLRLHVVGAGWWGDTLHRYAVDHGAGDTVVFEGHVDEERKHEIYAQAWVLVVPSLKEGWGLVIPEAGSHGTPAVAYRSAGGTRESIADGQSGLLVDDPVGLTAAVDRLLHDRRLRDQLGRGAVEHSSSFTWQQAQHAFAVVMVAALEGQRIGGEDPEEEVLGRIDEAGMPPAV